MERRYLLKNLPISLLKRVYHVSQELGLGNEIMNRIGELKYNMVYKIVYPFSQKNNKCKDIDLKNSQIFTIVLLSSYIFK